MFSIIWRRLTERNASIISKNYGKIHYEAKSCTENSQIKLFYCIESYFECSYVSSWIRFVSSEIASACIEVSAPFLTGSGEELSASFEDVVHQTLFLKNEFNYE